MTGAQQSAGHTRASPEHHHPSLVCGPHTPPVAGRAISLSTSYTHAGRTTISPKDSERGTDILLENSRPNGGKGWAICFGENGTRLSQPLRDEEKSRSLNFRSPLLLWHRRRRVSMQEGGGLEWGSHRGSLSSPRICNRLLPAEVQVSVRAVDALTFTTMLTLTCVLQGLKEKRRTFTHFQVSDPRRKEIATQK